MSSASGRGRLIKRGAVLLLISLVLVAAGLVWRHKTSPYHFLGVAPGVLYRSGRLRPSNLAKVIDDHGIRTVVNLCSKAENKQGDWHDLEATTCRENGAVLVDIPMEPETPPDDAQVEEWLRLLRNESARPILVHCRHGVVRTGMMVAIDRMEFEHAGNEETLKSLPMFGHRLNAEHRKPFRDFILEYVPRLGGDAARVPAGAEAPGD